jgi:hypothetical protein
LIFWTGDRQFICEHVQFVQLDFRDGCCKCKRAVRPPSRRPQIMQRTAVFRTPRRSRCDCERYLGNGSELPVRPDRRHWPAKVTAACMSVRSVRAAHLRFGYADRQRWADNGENVFALPV